MYHTERKARPRPQFIKQQKKNKRYLRVNITRLRNRHLGNYDIEISRKDFKMIMINLFKKLEETNGTAPQI